MDEPIRLNAADLSEGGVFIRTEFPLAEGTRFGCSFHLDNSRGILAEGEVVWVRHGPPDASPPPGMGIQFVEMDPDDAQRLRDFVTGRNEGGPLAGDLPRISLTLDGMGETVDGEFRSMSDGGVSAVAELPFLRVGSQVQIRLEDTDGPMAGRIAWLELEEDAMGSGEAPRVRLGIRFDDPNAAGTPTRASGAPIPLTTRKRDPGIAERPLTDEVVISPQVPLETPAEARLRTDLRREGRQRKVVDPLADPEPASALYRSEDRSGEIPRQPKVRDFKRRVRPRRRGGFDLGRSLTSLRQHAAQNPRIAMAIIAAAAILMIVVLTSLFSGGKDNKSPQKKSATQPPTAATPQPGETAPGHANAAGAPTPGAPGAGPGAVSSGAGPGAGAPGAGPGGAPPLPTAGGGTSGQSGQAVLQTGPGAARDPGQVLGDKGQPGAGTAPGELDDPAPSGQARVLTYRVGPNLVVKLPVAGSARKVRHYLLANPSGAVVDIRGAASLVKPGRYKVKTPLIKSVKVIRRGPRGARFIVYFGSGVKRPSKLRILKSAGAVKVVFKAGRAPRALAQRSGRRSRGDRRAGRRTRNARPRRVARRRGRRGGLVPIRQPQRPRRRRGGSPVADNGQP